MNRKVFIEVIVRYTREGRKIPLSIVWEDGRRFYIDRVMDVTQAASLKAGGQGIRYKCMIQGRKVFLWLEEGKWFMEAR